MVAYHSIDHIRLLILAYCSNYVPVLTVLAMIVEILVAKSPFLLTHVYMAATLGVTPLQFC